MKYLILGLFLIGTLWTINAPHALDHVRADISKYEGIDHAR